MKEENKEQEVVNASIEEVGKEIAQGEGTNEQKMATFLYTVSGNDMEMYYRTIDLLAVVDKFKKELKENER